MTGSGGGQRLSKSRYTAGLQCLKQLWWRVHEPDAPELVADEGLQAIFTRGQKVGELARAQIPGGVLIDLPHYDFEGKVAVTAKALADGAPAIFEASFFEDGVFVAVDILERRKEDFTLVEVKSTLDVKKEHLPDVAVQVHVVRGAGIPVAVHRTRRSDAPWPRLSQYASPPAATAVFEQRTRGRVPIGVAPCEAQLSQTRMRGTPTSGPSDSPRG